MASLNAFITGTSDGLGKGLCTHYLSQGWRVFGCSRRAGPDAPGDYRHQICDLADLDAIPANFTQLLAGASHLDLVILNAGMLGQLKPAPETSVAEIQTLMTVNTWANKVLLDCLYHWPGTVAQIVLISSGASISGSRGWGGYALSKAALNMLTQQYAHEFPHTHLSAIAPGLIDSKMMDYLCAEPDPEAFPALQRIRAARGSAAMPKPEEAARAIAEALPRVREFPSGAYVDLRQFTDPEAYRVFQQSLHAR